MSISSRSTKAAMYSEIERLRALLDQQERQELYDRADYEYLARALDKAERERDELRAQLSAPQPAAAPRPEPALSERGTRNLIRNLMMKNLAIVCKASVKWVDGQGFCQYKDGNWVVIPAHTVQYVAKGIGQ